ncbi:MAG: hypothetical protein IKB24_01045 [Alistipes sp.]|nr:hypothetical protein [Alistipes sp.]
MKLIGQKVGTYNIINKTLLSLLLIIILEGCSVDSKTHKLIRHAEEIAMELPDSALRVVQSIDPESVRGRHDRAHYKLVVTEAHYYNRLAVDRDTIAQPLFDYYIESDNHAERARALYQHAIVMQAEGENARAMFSLMEAEKSLGHLDNPRLSGLVHRTKGEIYGSECLFQNALEEYQKSKEYFDKANLQYHSVFCDFYIGKSLNYLNQFDEAEEYLQHSLEYAISTNNSPLVAKILLPLFEIYYSTLQFGKALHLFDEYEEYIKQTPATYYTNKAILSAKMGNASNAMNYLRLAEEEKCDVTDLEYTYYIVYRTLGDSEKALEYHEKCIKRQNELTLSSLNAPILNLQIELGISENNALQVRNENIKLRYMLFIALLSFIIISGVCYYLNRQRKHQAEIEQYISTIKELQMTTKDLPSQMNDSIDKLYKSRFKELNDLYDIYYDSAGSTRQMRIIFERISNTINSIKCDKKRLAELEKIVNEYRGNMMSKLLDLCPNLSERQRKIVLFSYAGFSLRAIALFMDSNPIQISKDKYKIKGIIKSCGDTKDSELFINSL